MKRRWEKVNIPREMYEHIRKLIEDPEIKKIYGFNSTSSFVIRAISEYIMKVEKNVSSLRLKSSESGTHPNSEN